MFKSHLTKFEKPHVQHIFKFQIWKKSMRLRYLIEGAFVVIMTIVFQYYMSLFNKYLHLAMHEIDHIHYMKADHGEGEDIDQALHLLHEELKEANHDLYEALLFSLV